MIRARMRFFIEKPNFKLGPYSETEVLRLIESGAIDRTMPCRRSVEEGWKTVADHLGALDICTESRAS